MTEEIEPGNEVLVDVEKAREVHSDYYNTDKEVATCLITDYPHGGNRDKYDFVGQSDDISYLICLFINEEFIIGKGGRCHKHKSKKLYHDGRKELFCPFCNK